MINFIVCDDNESVLDEVKTSIGKVMMKNKLVYKTYLFEDYNVNFKKVMNSKIPNKIYILDIETPTASGIDMARKIREKDIESVIIFLTSHNELGSVLLQDELMFLTFICKFNNQEHRLESAIKKALKVINVKQAIRFEDRGILYTIPLNDILYITHDSIERKCIVVTDNTEFKVNKTFSEMTEMLDKRFEQTHRACIINTDRVRQINKRNNTIVFDNKTAIDLLSKNYKRGIKV